MATSDRDSRQTGADLDGDSADAATDRLRRVGEKVSYDLMQLVWIGEHWWCRDNRLGDDRLADVPFMAGNQFPIADDHRHGRFATTAIRLPVPGSMERQSAGRIPFRSLQHGGEAEGLSS